MSEEWLPLSCPFCHAKFRIKSIYAHLKGRCPACNFRINAPKPRPVDLPAISDADEPLGLSPLHDDEWPEPPRLEEPEDDPDYGFTAAPIAFAKDGPPPDTVKPQAVEEPSAGVYSFKEPAADVSGVAARSAPTVPRVESKPEPIVGTYKPKDIFTDILADPVKNTPAPVAPPVAKGPPKLDEWGFPIEEVSSTAKPQAAEPVAPPAPTAKPAPPAAPVEYPAPEKPAPRAKTPKHLRDDYDMKADPKAHDPTEADKAAAQQIMREAHVELDRKEEIERGPIESPLWNGVYGYPFRKNSIRCWLLLTLGLTVLSLQGAAVSFFISGGLDIGSVVASGTLILGMFWIAVFSGSFGAANFMVIVQDTANGNENPPAADGTWKEWFFQFLMLMWVFGVWIGVPSGIVLMLQAPYLIPVILIFSLIIFPTSLLSTLASGSAWVLMNGTILGRIWKRKTVFFSMLLSSFFLWGLPGYLLYLTGRYSSFTAAFFAGPLWAAGVLIYARLLGRVGWILTEQDRAARKKRQRKKLKPKKRREDEESEPAAEMAAGDETDWDG